MAVLKDPFFVITRSDAWDTDICPTWSGPFETRTRAEWIAGQVLANKAEVARVYSLSELMDMGDEQEVCEDDCDVTLYDAMTDITGRYSTHPLSRPTRRHSPARLMTDIDPLAE